MPDAPAITLHASTVAIGGRAVMLCGASGSGKSDLALRLIDRGAVLVADDYTLLRAEIGGLLAAPPTGIAGKIEIRGIGIVEMPHMRDIPVGMIVQLTDAIERMPDGPSTRTIAGIDVPVMPLAPFEASAPIKVEHLLARFGLPPVASPAPDGEDARP